MLALTAQGSLSDRSWRIYVALMYKFRTFCWAGQSRRNSLTLIDDASVFRNFPYFWDSVEASSDTKNRTDERAREIPRPTLQRVKKKVKNLTSACEKEAYILLAAVSVGKKYTLREVSNV